MKIYTLFIITMMFMFSCNTKNASQKMQQIDKSIAEKTSVTIKTPAKENKYLIKKYSNLFNTELVGLTKDSINQNKYFVDFYAACMCDSPSILFHKNTAYLFNYCKDTLPPASSDPFYTYKITKMKEIANGIAFHLKNSKNEELTLKFLNTSNKRVFELVVDGYFPYEYIGSRLCHYFTNDISNFTVEDCGDFDG